MLLLQSLNCQLTYNGVMNLKILLKLLAIPFLLAIIHFAFLTYPYFFSKVSPYSSLGFLSLVEEKPINLVSVNQKRQTDQFDNHLFKNEKITGEFVADHNNLGIVMLRFVRFGGAVDTVTFRIKPAGEKKWHYENKYAAKQFQPDEYFTFGFPTLQDSKNKKYVFELESMNGKYDNSIGVSPDKSTAFVYSYTKSDLKDLNVLSAFLLKKFLYAKDNVNLFYILSTFITSFLLILLIKGYAFKIYDKEIKKRIIRFTKTNLYAVLLNKTWKKRVVISLLIFLLAFLYRLIPYFTHPTGLYYSAMGGQGDYDEMIRVSTCTLTEYCVGTIIYDFIFLTPLLGAFFFPLGYIGGIKIFLYLMIALSSLVALIPYFMLSRKNWFTIGGLFGSILLATNDFLVTMALGFPIDNSAIFFFSLFTLTYFATLQYGTLRWLFLFGILGIIDGLNKVLFLINQLVALSLFIPVFFYEQVKKTKRAYFKKANLKILLIATIPLVVFLALNFAWEYFVLIKFDAKYFLSQILIQKGGGYTAYVANENATANPIALLIYLSTATIIMIKRLLDYIDLPTFFFFLIFVSVFFFYFTKKKPLMKKTILVTVIFVLIFFTLLQQNVYDLHTVFKGDKIWEWDFAIYARIFLFIETIVLFVLADRYKAIRLFIPIITYVGMLVLMARLAPFPRLHTHVVVWSIVLLAYLIDWSDMKKKTRLASIFFMLFVCFYGGHKLIILTTEGYKGIMHHQQEVNYLKWVNGSLPSNTIILGGGNDNLVVTAENVQKPLIYNSLYAAAVMIPEDQDFRKVIHLDFMTYMKTKDNFEKNKYIILDENIVSWRKRLTQTGDSVFSKNQKYPNPKNYSLQVYKYNNELKKAIYELKFNKPSNVEDQTR